VRLSVGSAPMRNMKSTLRARIGAALALAFMLSIFCLAQSASRQLCWASPQLRTSTNDDPEQIVRSWFRAIFSGDKAKVNELGLPQKAVEALFGDEPRYKLEPDQVQYALNELKLECVRSFRLQGKDVSRGADGLYPEGTSVRYLAIANGNLTVVS